MDTVLSVWEPKKKKRWPIQKGVFGSLIKGLFTKTWAGLR